MHKPTYVINNSKVSEYKDDRKDSGLKWYFFESDQSYKVIDFLQGYIQEGFTDTMVNELQEHYEHPYIELNDQLQFVKCIYPVAKSELEIELHSSYWLITDNMIVSIGARSELIDPFKSQITGIANDKLRQYALLNLLFHCVADLYLKMIEQYNYSLIEWRKYYIKDRHPFDEWAELADIQDSISKQSLMAKLQLEYTEKFQDQYRESQSLRIIHQRFERLTNYYESLESKIKSSLDVVFIMQESRSNRILKLLALVSGVFLPLMFISGVFGMNFIDMPFLNNPWSFYILMLSFVMISLGMYLFFRVKKWL
jgi:Mg2+ and Co2+ transporter CorA